jgi:hypothetical protein
MEEDFDVLQRVGHRTGQMGDRTNSTKCSYYAGFVQLPVNSRQMSQTRRRQRADLGVVVPEELQMQLL